MLRIMAEINTVVLMFGSARTRIRGIVAENNKDWMFLFFSFENRAEK